MKSSVGADVFAPIIEKLLYVYRKEDEAPLRNMKTILHKPIFLSNFLFQLLQNYCDYQCVQEEIM